MRLGAPKAREQLLTNELIGSGRIIIEKWKMANGKWQIQLQLCAKIILTQYTRKIAY
jgi:hypothetical protein